MVADFVRQRRDLCMNARDKTRRACIRGATALLACLAVTLAFAASPRAPITMEDMLGAEGIGNVVFSPDDQTFAFERTIPIARQGNWGYDDAELVRTRGFVMDRGGSAPTEVPNTA